MYDVVIFVMCVVFCVKLEQVAEKRLARFLKNCECIVSQGVVSLMLHDTCMYREPVTR